MRVIATAGHVDHGKSTLVRALTGTDPDRWAEEHRRGLTIDLGFAWTVLPQGQQVAFVDVPGHQRFIANMLAGIGPSPAVLLVIAADEGWRQQSTEHLAAIRALGIQRGVVAITRADLADPAHAAAQVAERLAGTPLEGSEVIACSPVTGEGMEDLRDALSRLCAQIAEPRHEGRIRLWIDRVFTVRGAGTVVTGTLEAGTLRVGDEVELLTDHGRRSATVRGLQSLEESHREVAAVARVAVNLRGVEVDNLSRGDAVVTPGSWHLTEATDVRLLDPPETMPELLMVHVGTLAVQVRVRPLGEGVARLSWPRPVALQVGDRLVLRDPGRQLVLCGAQVLDADPPNLTRRGDARRRAASLAEADIELDVVAEVARRGWMRASSLHALGASSADLERAATTRAGKEGKAVRVAGDLLVAPGQWRAWVGELGAAVDRAIAENPLQARLPLAQAADALRLPDRGLLPLLAEEVGLVITNGHLERPGRGAHLGEAEAGLVELEQRLAAEPFAAPERHDLDALGLGPKQVAAAVRMGRLIDLGDRVLLAPRGPAQAMRVLSQLEQPFTTSQARQALGSTRRVVIPLLEFLDRKGWTRRLPDSTREVVRGGKSR